jgi:hypothetical protein
MSLLTQQLVAAYRRQRELYAQVLELVGRQKRIMETSPDPGAVLGLCRQVETLMGQIAVIEDATRPAKDEWERTREDPGGELNEELKSVEATIGQVGRMQQFVQDRLLDYMRGQQERADGTRTAIRINRANRLYRAG